MENLGIARALHVLAVVVWIGGVAMVTTVLLPATRRLKTPHERIALFEEVEHGFAAQARWSTLVAGLSGAYLVYAQNLWGRFLEPGYWWMHAMVCLWLVYALMLFVLEPLVLNRWFEKSARRDPEGTLRRIERMHWILLAVSLATVAAAAAGAHGLL